MTGAGGGGVCAAAEEVDTTNTATNTAAGGRYGMQSWVTPVVAYTTNLDIGGVSIECQVLILRERLR